MHGLTQLQQHEVGDIDDVGHRAKPAQREAAAHPARRRADLDVRDVMSDIAGAERRLLDRDGDLHVRRVRDIVGRGGLQGLFEDGGDLARHAEHALAVGTVRRHRDVKDIVVDADDGADIDADGRIVVQNEDAVDLRARIEVVGDAQFLARAEHALGRDAAQLARLDLLDAALVQDGRIIERNGNDRALKDVGRSGADLLCAVRAAVHLTDSEPVRIGVLFRLGDAPRDDVRDVLAEVGELLHLEPAGEQLVLQFLRGDIDLYIVF